MLDIKQDSIPDSLSATREPNRLNSAFGGNVYSIALRREINGRLSAGCSILRDIRPSSVEGLNFLRRKLGSKI